MIASKKFNYSVGLVIGVISFIVLAFLVVYLASNIPAFNEFSSSTIGEACALQDSGSACGVYSDRFIGGGIVSILLAPYSFIGAFSFLQLKKKSATARRTFLVVSIIPTAICLTLALYVLL